ncbi:hypothetical protein AAC387_Pa06g2173 [Persea americana]
MEALHKQVIPFLLRRTKDEVLSDWPEKIIQDRYCDLSPVQLKLYEQFSGTNARKETSALINVDVIPNAGEEASSSPKASAHFTSTSILAKAVTLYLSTVKGHQIPFCLFYQSSCLTVLTLYRTFMSYTTLPNWALFKRYWKSVE